MNAIAAIVCVAVPDYSSVCCRPRWPSSAPTSSTTVCEVGDLSCVSDRAGTVPPPSKGSGEQLQRTPVEVSLSRKLPPLKKLRLSYDCDICETTYTEKRSLLRHFKAGSHCQKAGTLATPHPCTHCDSTFSRDDIRQRHEKEVHFFIKRYATRDVIPGYLSEPSTVLENPLCNVSCDSILQPNEQHPTLQCNGGTAEICVLEERKLCRATSNADSAYCESLLDACSLSTSFDSRRYCDHGSCTANINDSAVDMTWTSDNHENVAPVASGSQINEVNDDQGSIRSVSTTSTLKSQVKLARRPLRSALVRQGLAPRLRDENDHLFCALCDFQMGSNITEIRLHINEHAKEYTQYTSQYHCHICQIGFAHEKDLDHHRIYSSQGHCGFNFEHAEPCCGHHPPDIFSDMLTNNDRLQFESRLRHWEKAQLNVYLDHVGNILCRNSIRDGRERWSIGALLDSFESLTSLMGNVRLSSDPDPSDYQRRICGRRRAIGDHFVALRSTYYSVSNTVKLIGHRRIRNLTAKEKLLQLVRASMSGDVKRAELLLSASADVNGSVVINDGQDGEAITVNPVIAAAWNGNTRILNALIERGADVNLQCRGSDAMHRTPLFAATAQGHSEIVQLLLGWGARIDLSDYVEYGNALCGAAKAGNLDIVRIFLENGADVNSRGGSLVNPLGFAIHNGNTEVAEYLLQQGAHVAFDICQHGTALECASSSGNLGLVLILLQHGATDVQHKALEIAASNGHVDIFEVLANQNCESSAERSNPRYLLARACFWARENTVRMLLEKIIDVHLYNDERCSNLAWAILGQSPVIVRCLLENGVLLMSKRQLEFILFRGTGTWRAQCDMVEDSFAAFEACCTAVTICKTLCAVIENIESSPGNFTNGALVLAM